MKKYIRPNYSLSLPKLSIALLIAGLAASSAFAQGSLNPPGAPAPTMKSLDQIEARVPISALPFTIAASGSYYLTTNLTGVSGLNGISIGFNVNDVTVDLNGFTLIGVPGSLHGITSSGSRITVMNGIVRNWGSDGVNCAPDQNNVFKNLLAISNGITGLDIGTRGLVENCQAEANATHGIAVAGGSIVRNCLANHNGNIGINCYNTGSVGSSATVTGCAAAQNSIGISIGANSFVSENNLLNNSFAGVNANFNGSRIEYNNFAFNYNGINTPAATNVIVRNSFTGNTNAAVLGIAAGMPVGPLINGTAMATNTNPCANYSY